MNTIEIPLGRLATTVRQDAPTWADVANAVCQALTEARVPTDALTWLHVEPGALIVQTAWEVREIEWPHPLRCEIHQTESFTGCVLCR